MAGKHRAVQSDSEFSNGKLSGLGPPAGGHGKSPGPNRAAVSENKLQYLASRNPAHRIHVALIDPDAVIQTVFSNALAAAGPEWQLLTYNTLEQALHRFTMVHPDVVLLGGPAGSCRTESILDLHMALRGTPIIVLADAAETGDVLLCLKAGARGFLVKTLDPLEITASLTRVLRGEHILCSPALERLAHWMRFTAGPGPTHGLTTREQQVLAFLAENLSNKEISDELGTSESTIHGHVAALLRKTGLHDRHAIARWYLTGPN